MIKKKCVDILVIQKEFTLEKIKASADKHVKQNSKDSIAIYIDGSKSDDKKLQIGIIIPQWEI